MLMEISLKYFRIVGGLKTLNLLIMKEDLINHLE